MATLRYDIDVDERRAERRIGAFALSMRRQITQAVRSLPDIELNADSTDAQREVAEVRRALVELSQQRIDVDISANEAQRRLTELTARLRALQGASGDVRIDADTAAALGALGAVDDAVDDLDGRRATVKIDVDKSLSDTIIRVAQLGRSLGMLAMPVAALQMIPQAAAIAASLADLTGIAGLIPAVVLAGGAAFAAAKVGLTGFGDAMKALGDPEKFAEAVGKLAPAARETAVAVRDLGPAWKALQLDVQGRLFAGMASEVRELARAGLPLLRSGLGGIAVELNASARSLLNWVQTAQTTRDVSSIFEATRKSLHELVPAGRNVATALLDIGTIGSRFLPNLAAGVTKLTDNFRTFIAHVRETGQLQEWIQGGIDKVAQLGRILGNVGGSIAAFFSAADTAGGDFLDTAEKVTEELETLLSSNVGQAGITAVFREIDAAVDAVLPGVREFATSFLEAVRAAANTGGLRTAAAAISDLLTAAAPLLPVLATLAGEALRGVATEAAFMSGPLSVVVDFLIKMVDVLGPVGPMVVGMVAAFQLLGPVSAIVAGLGVSLAGMLTFIGGSSAAAGRLVSVFARIGTALPIVGVAVIGLGILYDQLRDKTDDLAKAVLDGSQDFTLAVNKQEVAIQRQALAMEMAEGEAGTMAAGVAELTGKTDESTEAVDAHQQAVDGLLGSMREQADAMLGVEQAQARVKIAQVEWNLAVEEFGENSPQAAAATQALASASSELERAERDTAEATQSHTDSIIAQQEAINTSLSAGLAYEQSLRSVERAQIAAAEATGEHGAASLEAREAVGRLESSVLSAADAAGRKAAADSGATDETEKNRIATTASNVELLRWASSADGPARDAALRMLSRLSDTELQTLQNTGAMSGFAVEIRRTPDGKVVAVTTPGLDAARAGLQGLQTDIRNINGKTVSIFVTATGSGGLASAGRLATGGIMPGYTPGRDVHLAALSGGEAVMRPEWTRAVTPAYVHSANRAARSGGVAGVQSFLAHTLPRRAEGVHGDGSAFATGGIQRLAAGGLVINTPYRRDLSAFNAAMAAFEQKALQLGQGLFGGVAGPTTVAAGRGLAWARTQAGKPYIWGGVGPRGYDCSGFMSAIVNVMRGRNPHSRVGATGSFPWAGFRPGLGLGLNIGSFRGSPGHMAGTIGGINVESSGSVGVRVGGGARGASSSMFRIRAHLADQGALLRSGEAALNLSGMPERVLSPAATRGYDGALGAGATVVNTRIVNNVAVTLPSSLSAMTAVDKRRLAQEIRAELDSLVRSRS